MNIKEFIDDFQLSDIVEILKKLISKIKSVVRWIKIKIIRSKRETEKKIKITRNMRKKIRNRNIKLEREAFNQVVQEFISSSQEQRYEEVLQDIDEKPRHLCKRKNSDTVTVAINKVVKAIPINKVWMVPEDVKQSIIVNEDNYGIVTNVNVLNINASVTSAHVVSLMGSESFDYTMINPQVYSNRRCREIKLKPKYMKIKDSIYINTMTVDKKIPVIIETEVYDVIRYNAKDNRHFSNYPMAITFILPNADEYILSGSFVIFNKVPYIVSSTIYTSEDENCYIVFANIMQPHNTTIEITTFVK